MRRCIANQQLFGLLVRASGGRGALTGGARLQFFKRRFAVHRLVVHAGHQRAGDEPLALLAGDGADLPAGRDDVHALGHAGAALGVEKADQRLAHGQFGDGALDVQAGIAAHGVGGGGLDGFLVERGEGAQRVLHAVAQLRQHGDGYVGGVLSDQIDADALGAHQPHHQFDAFQQRLGRVGEQQVRFVEEEGHFGLLGVADFGQGFEQFGQQPQQEGGVQARRGDPIQTDLFRASVPQENIYFTRLSTTPNQLSPFPGAKKIISSLFFVGKIE